MTAAWSAWTPYPAGEKNRYFDWNIVSGGIEPTWRLRGGDGGNLLDFPEIDPTTTQALRNDIRKDLEPMRGHGGGPAGDLHSDDLQDALLLLLLSSVIDQFANPALRLPPVPPGSATTCNNEYRCYFDHVLRYGALPADIAGAKAGGDLPQELRIDKDSVIVGVLDVGIPLGHRETRLPDGSTRILASWQQTANRAAFAADPDDKANQFYLPSGREILAHEINAALDQHSPQGKAAGFLDEEAFNRALGLEDYTTPFGQRDLGLRASHGAHILGAATGMPATHPDAARARIIAVNMPDRSLVGHSAQFLEYFAVHGIMRVVMLADALWDKLHRADTPRDPEGFPIVINLSFGKQASSRDTLDPLTRLVRRLNRLRQAQNRRPVVLAMPAGNENLTQGNIRTRLEPGARVAFDWRISPEDQSANFVEIWTRQGRADDTASPPLAIRLQAPGSTASAFEVGQDARVLDYTDASAAAGGTDRQQGILARVYSDRFPCNGQNAPIDPDMVKDKLAAVAAELGADEPSEVDLGDSADSDAGQASGPSRHRYLVAAKQTLLNESEPVAPAGMWRIWLENRARFAVRVDVNVQSDQTEHPRLVVNQRSYFERREYQRVDETGRVVDTATYPLDGTSPAVTDTSPVLRRHGTINALGFTPNVFLAAGHRASDGRMMPYSSTGILRRNTGRPLPKRAADAGGGRIEGAAPLASLPIRTGPAHFGTLAAGSRDGSVAAMEGTSFAAAQLTRHILDLFLKNPDADVFSAIKAAVTAAESASPPPGMVLPLKAGLGRLKPPDVASGHRTGRPE